MGELKPSGREELPDHLLLWLEAAQRRVGTELDAVLDDAAREVGPRRLRILQLVPPGGARQKELAERALVTKQAMAEILDALEADALIERTPDPSDGRAWLVVRSAHGTEVSDALDRSMQAVEAGLARSLGTARYQSFKDVLRELGEKQI